MNPYAFINPMDTRYYGTDEAFRERLRPYASEEATVVVGTVIDPELTDELKVTVVATGLGSEVVRAPLQVVEAASSMASWLHSHRASPSGLHWNRALPAAPSISVQA